MRVHLKGIHKVRKQLADGSHATYFYAWRGGPRLNEIPNTSAFVAAFAAAQNDRKKIPSNTVRSLIQRYKASADFSRLAKTTQNSYESYLADIEKEFGLMLIEWLSNNRARGVFKEWRDTMAKTPRKADLAWTVLARVMSFSKDRGFIPANPCERGGRLHSGTRADRVWSDEQLGAILAEAEDYMKLAINLALWTGQRQGDVLRLQWSDYDGTCIRLIQSKTDRTVVIPVAGPLKAVLDKTKRHGPYILSPKKKKKGFYWTSDGFRASWSKLCARAGIKGLTFHDLRGTAVTKLARAGATVAEIASVTGHSLSDVATILDRHYLGDRAGLAASGIEKLEKNEKRFKTVN